MNDLTAILSIARNVLIDYNLRILDSNQVHMLPTKDIARYRIQKRQRENSRRGGVSLEYNSRHFISFKRNNPDGIYDGEQKWDLLIEDMKERGWLKEYPATIKIRTTRKTRLWDGHHRIGVALELDIDLVPVQFIY